MSASSKGFTMLEMLVSLLIISALLLVTLHNTSNINLDHYYFLNEYVLKQSDAMLNKEEEYLDHGVSFNTMGRVNQARTIELGRHKVLIHLGNGYASYE